MIFRPRRFVSSAGAASAAAVCLSAALLWSATAAGAQIVALDLKPTKGVPIRLAEALSPILVAELAKREGMSVISQADVAALLELEGTKQAMGCDTSSCLTDLAGSLGAELLATSTLSRVGPDYVINITLIQVEGAAVVRRSSATARGGERAAPAAIAEAVHGLFRDGLPSNLQGPASMSRRGFEAALAGLRRAVLTQGEDPKPGRRRVILDVVNTELDYDAKPKLEMLDREIRQGAREAFRRALAVKTTEEANHYQRALETYTALRHDHGRVVEIRERARERGTVPSGQPLRFEDPEPAHRPDSDAWASYWKRSADARAVVAALVRALSSGDKATYTRLWATARQTRATKDFESRRERAKDRKYTWWVMTELQHPVELRKTEAERRVEPNKVYVYLLRRRDGVPETERRVTLVKELGGWRVDNW